MVGFMIRVREGTFLFGIRSLLRRRRSFFPRGPPVEFLKQVQLLLDLTQHRVLLVLQSDQLLPAGVYRVTSPQAIEPILNAQTKPSDTITGLALGEK